MLYIPCECHKNPQYELKVEADFCSDPIWCTRCNNQLDIDLIPLTAELKESLIDWAIKYGEWINQENDTLVENGFNLENLHNEVGQKLTKKINIQLGENYVVSFVPSNIESTYKN